MTIRGICDCERLISRVARGDFISSHGVALYWGQLAARAGETFGEVKQMQYHRTQCSREVRTLCVHCVPLGVAGE
eukprot:9477512-Pyramimonas_sp.AAC.1